MLSPEPFFRRPSCLDRHHVIWAIFLGLYFVEKIFLRDLILEILERIFWACYFPRVGSKCARIFTSLKPRCCPRGDDSVASRCQTLVPVHSHHRVSYQHPESQSIFMLFSFFFSPALVLYKNDVMILRIRKCCLLEESAICADGGLRRYY